MKWFKHSTSTAMQEKIVQLRAAFGIAGYGAYFIILENIASLMDGTDRTQASFTLNFLQSLTGFSPKTLKNFLVFCQNLCLFSVEFQDKIVIIDCPKLDLIRDETTERYRRKLGATLELPPSKKKENTPPIASQAGDARPLELTCQTVLAPKTSNLPTHQASFEVFWRAYPQAGRKAKAKCQKIWEQKNLRTLLPKILDGIKRLESSCSLWKDGFIPHATTFLNGKRWEDEPTPPQRGHPIKSQGVPHVYTPPPKVKDPYEEVEDVPFFVAGPAATLSKVIRHELCP